MRRVDTLITKDVEMNEPIKLTDEHKRMLAYYWQEQRDLSAYAYFKELEPLIRKEMPVIWRFWSDYATSKKALDAMMERLL